MNQRLLFTSVLYSMCWSNYMMFLIGSKHRTFHRLTIVSAGWHYHLRIILTFLSSKASHPPHTHNLTAPTPPSISWKWSSRSRSSGQHALLQKQVKKKIVTLLSLLEISQVHHYVRSSKLESTVIKITNEMIAYATLHKYDIFICGIVQTKHIRQMFRDLQKAKGKWMRTLEWSSSAAPSCYAK